jgi:xanthine dehydrogenase accessory factor
VVLSLADHPRRAPGPELATAVVKGGGEVGTAVALSLWRAGWRVVVAEMPRPTVLRRQLSLAEAAFAGSVVRERVRARRVTTPREAIALTCESATIPLYVGSIPQLVAALQPGIVVDARMRRGAEPEPQRHEAPLVIGLGPDLIGGRHVDLVIETCPGPDLGRVVTRGAARPHVPLPRAPGSLAEEYVRAPVAGWWRSERTIGERVTEGDLLGWLDDEALHAPVAGCLRGLVHDAVAAHGGLKLAAVHPGDWQRKETGIGRRATAIAASVLAVATARARRRVPLAQPSAAVPAAAI